jgi:hypothetical protein
MTSTARSSAWVLLVFLLAHILGLGGCAHSLPAYPNLPDREALEVLAGRAESVRSIRTLIELNIENAQGESIELDGAFVAIPPDRMRLQAWKFGATVLDVTYVGGEVWTVTDSDQPPAPGIESLTGITSGQLQRLLALSRASFWLTARPVGSANSSRDLVVESGLPNLNGVTCSIDRQTLTARRFTLSGSEAGANAERSLATERYRLIDGVAWPTRLTFGGPEGTVRVDLSEVEINHPIEDAAFVPPRRARKQP